MTPASKTDGNIVYGTSFAACVPTNKFRNGRYRKWLGHPSSAMIKKYYHLHDEESHRQMEKLEFGDDPWIV
jgi:hypothetical protein